MQQNLIIKYLTFYEQNIIVNMQSLLERSRRKANQNQSPVKLKNISPQKFGSGAFCDLTFTPSKLADNVLYRQVTTLKKIEQGNGKLRQTEALNSLFQDRLQQLKQERDGIQKSLTSQITMYKKLLHQCEVKSQARIKQVQTNFKLQIKRIILEKQEEAKYAQSQKQLLQKRIQQLQVQLNQLKDRYQHQGKQYQDLRNQKEKLDINYHNSCQNLAQLESKRSIEGEQAKKKQQQLNRQIFTNNVQHKRQLQETINAKNKQIQALQRLQRTQLQKLQNKRAAEQLMKNQELKDITNAFQAEGKRQNQIIAMKQRMIDTINKDLNKEKQKVLQLTRSYQNQINNLSHQKARLCQQIDSLNNQNTALTVRLNDNQNLYQRQKLSLQNCIHSLKDQLQLNQVNFIREKDRNSFIASDFQKQLHSVRSQNLKLKSLMTQNQLLIRQTRNLRELLLQSSHQMQKCKQQFLRMGKERDILVSKLRDLGCENEVLHRIKMQREEEARGWKQSYYMSKRN